jgi:hypothetical protein
MYIFRLETCWTTNTFKDKGWGFFITRSVGSFYVLLYVFYRSDGFFCNETLVMCRPVLVSCAMTRVIDEDLFPM